MSKYRGVVHNNVVVPDSGVQLPEGTQVEIHLLEPAISRAEAFAQIVDNRIPFAIGIDEIIADDKREREERADRWLQ